MAGVDVPDDAALGQLAADLLVRIRWAERLADPPREGPVILMPAALSALLTPVLSSLALRDTATDEGPEAPAAFSPDLTLVDDDRLSRNDVYFDRAVLTSCSSG